MMVSVHLCSTCGRDSDSVLWNKFPTSAFGLCSSDIYVCGTCAQELGLAVKNLAKEMRARNRESVPGRVPTVANLVSRWMKLLKP